MAMNHPKLAIMRKAASRKLAVLLLISVSAVASFATLGDGNKKGGGKSSLLSSRTKSTSFTLRSGYTFRGNQVINTETNKRYISLNTKVTLQRGNTTFILPLKKKVVSNVKIDLGNRQFLRN
jgi:hypothetical protein